MRLYSHNTTHVRSKVVLCSSYCINVQRLFLGHLAILVMCVRINKTEKRITNEQSYRILDELYTSYLSLQEVVQKIYDKIVKMSCNNINEQYFLFVAFLPDLKWCAICMCHSHRWGCVFQINYSRRAHAWSHLMKVVLHSSSIGQLWIKNVWYSVVRSGFVFRPA